MMQYLDLVRNRWVIRHHQYQQRARVAQEDREAALSKLKFDADERQTR